MARHNPTSGSPDPQLAHRLFGAVETAQGYAFISDGIEVLSRAEILDLARASLKWTRVVAKTLEQFLSEAEELNSPRTKGNWEP